MSDFAAIREALKLAGYPVTAIYAISDGAWVQAHFHKPGLSIDLNLPPTATAGDFARLYDLALIAKEAE